MHAPDFAQLGPPSLENRDLLFLFEHFPVPGVDAVAAAQRVHEQPNTLESLLESRYVFDAIQDRRTLWLEVSPKLFFNVLLRRCLPGKRRAEERRTLHYLANLLGLFAKSERLYQVQPGEEKSFQYLVDLVQEAAQSGPERNFVVQCQIGNFALFQSGWCADWIEHRHQYGRRPVDVQYYCKLGRSYYFTAAQNFRAAQLGLKPVFGELARRFDYYREGLQRMRAELTAH